MVSLASTISCYPLPASIIRSFLEISLGDRLSASPNHELFKPFKSKVAPLGDFIKAVWYWLTPPLECPTGILVYIHHELYISTTVPTVLWEPHTSECDFMSHRKCIISAKDLIDCYSFWGINTQRDTMGRSKRKQDEASPSLGTPKIASQSQGRPLGTGAPLHLMRQLLRIIDLKDLGPWGDLTAKESPSSCHVLLQKPQESRQNV